MNRKGPRIEPWWTPLLTCSHLDNPFLITTHCLLLLRKALIHNRTLPQIPYVLSLVSWNNHMPPACWSTFWKSIFKHQLGCGFDILDSISSFLLYFDICNYICLDTSYNFSALSLLLKYSLFFSSTPVLTNIFHRRSLCTFYLEIRRLSGTVSNALVKSR